MKEIHIQPVLNGFIVKIGCLKVVFTNIDMLCRELRRYHEDPMGTEKWYQEHAINDVGRTSETRISDYNLVIGTGSISPGPAVS